MDAARRGVSVARPAAPGLAAAATPSAFQALAPSLATTTSAALAAGSPRTAGPAGSSSPKRRKTARAAGASNQHQQQQQQDDDGTDDEISDGGGAGGPGSGGPGSSDPALGGAMETGGSAQKYRYYRLRAKQRQMGIEEELSRLREENQLLRDRENKLLYLVLMSRNRDRQLEVVERQRDELLMRLQYDTECALAIRTLSAQLHAAVAARGGSVPAGVPGLTEAPAARHDDFLTDPSTQPATQGAMDARSSQPDPATREPPSPPGAGSFSRPPWQGNLFGSFGPMLPPLAIAPGAVAGASANAGAGAGASGSSAAAGGAHVKLQPLQSPFGSLLGGASGPSSAAANAATAAAVDQIISGDMFPQLRESLLKTMVATEQDSVRMAAASQAAYTAGVSAVAALNAFNDHERPEDALMTLARSGTGQAVAPKRSGSPSDPTAPADAEPPLQAAHGFASRFRGSSPASSVTFSPAASPTRGPSAAVPGTRRA